MNWLTAGLIVAVLGGATLGTVMAVRSPDFWFGLIVAAFKAALPFVMKQMSPEDLDKWHEAIRRGTDDEFRRRRTGAPPKG